MSIVKKIKLNLIERDLESIVLFCSKIKVLQEELNCLEERMEYNKNEFSSGNLSESIYNINRKSSLKENRKLATSIGLNIKKSIKKVESIEKALKEVSI